ncbi:DAGLA [Cordylochernes scorpioides]|uniref:DAGLA n=1 Tax=Cordylochernes scorpioides TaxID=51811 RepID=A0ABY6LPD1_9ARAC|nr:DAGLA [Cordylochernes scorpioides]
MKLPGSVLGRPILHRNPEKVSQISNLIREETGISKSLVGSIIKEDLQLKKTPSKFVPKMLTIQQKENRVEVAKKCLKWWKKTLIGRKKY